MTKQYTQHLSKLFLLAFLLGTGSVLAHDEAKIAVVNLDYVAAYSPEGKKLQAKLESFQKEIQAEIDSKQNELKALRQRIVDGSNSLSQEKLIELQKEFEDLQIAMKRFSDDKQREAQKMRNDALQNIEKSLEPVFQKIKKEQGYDLILNNVGGVVILASKKVNITQQVIDLLNK